MVPEELKYTEEHQWVQRIAGSRVRVGLTDYAQTQLGDIVFIQLPRPGDTLTPGQSLGELESTKAVSDIYASLAGKVSAANDVLGREPGTLIIDCYGDGWLLEIDLDDVTELDGLLDAAMYTDLISGLRPAPAGPYERATADGGWTRGPAPGRPPPAGRAEEGQLPRIGLCRRSAAAPTVGACASESSTPSPIALSTATPPRSCSWTPRSRRTAGSSTSPPR